jgi:2-polyprenyl-3-methyl-5-hydroxy-6-metoxy-1,4-benzoquinol methylase
MQQALWPVIAEIAGRLDEAGIAYMFRGSTALLMQGVAVPQLQAVEVNVQWDLFDAAHALFKPFGAGAVTDDRGRPAFRCTVGGMPVIVRCRLNYVVAADPARVAVTHGGRSYWVRSAAYYRRHLSPGDPRYQRIAEWLQRQQEEHSRHNRQAWTGSNYEAWLQRFGTPAEAARRIQKDPAGRLASLEPYLGGPLAGRRVMNLLGSHGSKAVAMALLGADVTVADISAENARYATELAEAAGVQIRYLVADVLDLPEEELSGTYDLVLMELGVLHYFIDLHPLARVIFRLLKPGGRLVLQDFHPFSTKLITSAGKKHKVTGDYFATGLEETDVAYSKYAGGGGTAVKARLRKWTLGEVITAVASEGLFIRSLDEEPNTKADDQGIPKTFTLVAERV